MAELTTARKGRSRGAEALQAERSRAARSGRDGRLAASEEARALDFDAVADALAGDTHAAGCGSCEGGAATQPETGSAGAQQDSARVADGDGGRTSPMPEQKMQEEVDKVVREANEEDARKVQEEGAGGGEEGATPDAGGGGGGGAGGGGGGAQSVSRSASAEVAPAAASQPMQAASSAPISASSAVAAPSATDPYAIMVGGAIVGHGEAIPGTFQANSGFGAAMARGGHAMGCIHCMAGTNSWAKPGGFPGTLGLTTVRNAFTGPSFDIETEERAKVSGEPSVGGFVDYVLGTGDKEWVATVKPTSSTDATHPCVSSPAGEHKTGTTMVNVKGTPTAYETFLNITPAYAGKIWAAEDEHLADALLAYNISLKKAADEVNKLARPGQKWVADTKADAEAGPKGALTAAMPAKLGIDPTTWRTAVWSLCLLTISGRDNLGWHTFYTSAAPPDHGNKKVVSSLTDGTTQIGSHSSSSVVSLSKI